MTLHNIKYSPTFKYIYKLILIFNMGFITKQELYRLEQEMSHRLRQQNKRYIGDFPTHFQENIVDVIATDGIPYSDINWVKNLIIITGSDKFIPFSLILASEQWQKEDEQPYFKFVKGIIEILSVVKFNEDKNEVLKLAKSILQIGLIEGTTYTSGYLAGKQKFLFSKMGYRWF